MSDLEKSENEENFDLENDDCELPQYRFVRSRVSRKLQQLETSSPPYPILGGLMEELDDLFFKLTTSPSFNLIAWLLIGYIIGKTLLMFLFK